MAADGVVAIGRFTPAQAESPRSVSENVVFLNSSPDDARFDSVVLNYELGIRLALTIFWAWGTPGSDLSGRPGGWEIERNQRRRSAGRGSSP
ncbi:MAG: hypothetical protein ACLSAF_17590 [Intestinimonas sp.]